MTWWRNLLRHPLRSALAVAGITVTTAMLLDMVLLGGGLERSFERLLLGRGYQIRVSPSGTLPFDTETTIPGAAALRLGLEADPEVTGVAPVLGASVFARAGDTLVAVFAYGIDPEVQAIYQPLSGSDLAAGDSLGVLLSAPAAARLGMAPGDTLVLVGRLDPQLATAAIERRLVVRGVARLLYDSRGQLSLVALLPVVQSLAGLREEDRVSAFVVRARSDDQADAVTARLRSAHPGIEVNSVTDMVRHFRERLVYFRQLSYILGSISLVVTVLLVTTLMTITVNERLGEIATLRAIGVSRATVVRSVMLEGATLTVVGGGLGIVLGLATARYLDAILTTFPGLPAAISFFVPEPDRLLLAGVVLFLAGVGAGVYPAIIAARAPIADTLRAEAT
ncbi:MAG: ABC transporter permease [Gemmatimonadota bacterium]|nr:ABC transporter permease [Gemmatimonadota bacterium]